MRYPTDLDAFSKLGQLVADRGLDVAGEEQQGEQERRRAVEKENDPGSPGFVMLSWCQKPHQTADVGIGVERAKSTARLEVRSCWNSIGAGSPSLSWVHPDWPELHWTGRQHTA